MNFFVVYIYIYASSLFVVVVYSFFLVALVRSFKIIPYYCLDVIIIFFEEFLNCMFSFFSSRSICKRNNVCLMRECKSSCFVVLVVM